MKPSETPNLSLGLDIGTTTLSATVVDITNHRQLEAWTLPNDAALPAAESDRKEQDPARILRAALELLRSILQAYPGVRVIGVTGQMHGILYLDADGQAVSPLYTWQDARANRPISGTDGGSYCDEIRAVTGISVSPGYGLATHYYNVKNGLVPEQAVTLCTIMDYIVLRLTGRRDPLMHSTNAASLGFYDLTAHAFDTESLARLGMTADDTSPDGIRLPQVTDEVVCAGLYGEIPVYTALGDNQASFFGTVRSDADLLVNYGTGSQVSLVADSPQPVPGMEIRPYVGGLYLRNGSALCGGRAYALLGQFFSAYLLACGEPDHEPYAVMNRLAEAAYGMGDPVRVETTFCGTRSDPEKRGSISGIGEGNFTPGAFVLGVLQGMVDELYDMYAGSGSAPYEHVVASGNAVQKNPVLQKLLADKFGAALKLPTVREEAAFGAALAAAIYGGLGTAEEVKRCIRYQ